MVMSVAQSGLSACCSLLFRERNRTLFSLLEYSSALGLIVEGQPDVDLMSRQGKLVDLRRNTQGHKQ